VDDFSRAVALDAKHLAARKNLGRAFLALNKPDEALRVLEPARELAPSDPDVLAALGDACLSKRDMQQAMSWYRQSMKRESDPAKKLRLLIRIGLAQEGEGSATQAARSYERAMAQIEDPALKQALADRIQDLKPARRR